MKKEELEKIKRDGDFDETFLENKIICAGCGQVDEDKTIECLVCGRMIETEETVFCVDGGHVCDGCWKKIPEKETAKADRSESPTHASASDCRGLTEKEENIILPAADIPPDIVTSVMTQFFARKLDVFEAVEEAARLGAESRQKEIDEMNISMARDAEEASVERFVCGRINFSAGAEAERKRIFEQATTHELAEHFRKQGAESRQEEIDNLKQLFACFECCHDGKEPEKKCACYLQGKVDKNKEIAEALEKVAVSYHHTRALLRLVKRVESGEQAKKEEKKL